MPYFALIIMFYHVMIACYQLSMLYLYTCGIAFIFVICDYLSVYFMQVTCDKMLIKHNNT